MEGRELLLKDLLIAGGRRVQHFIRHTSRTRTTVFVTLLVVDKDSGGVVNISALAAAELGLVFSENHMAVMMENVEYSLGASAMLVYDLGDKLDLPLKAVPI